MLYFISLLKIPKELPMLYWRHWRIQDNGELLTEVGEIWGIVSVLLHLCIIPACLLCSNILLRVFFFYLQVLYELHNQKFSFDNYCTDLLSLVCIMFLWSLRMYKCYVILFYFLEFETWISRESIYEVIFYLHM